MSRLKGIVGLMVIFIGLTACNAHYPRTRQVLLFESLEDYSIEEKGDTQRAEELLLILTFSGGGTRAAAFSYGVLKALADTEIMVNGKVRRLLDEVDAISSVSGGSFTAAYFGLFGDRIFEDYESKFLKHNVQADLVKKMLSPFSWPKMWSLYYDRSDLAADFYDTLLFENKTFKDINSTGGPLIAINATDAALGSQFTFIGSQFAPICADLASFPVSRAVAASSAVPGAFTSVILNNHAGTCDYEIPEWALKALKGKTASTRQYHYARNLRAYLDVANYPYIHLFDGGISDNLGIRTIISGMLPTDNAWKKLEELKLEKTGSLVVIVVNSRNEQDVSFAKKDYSVPFIDTLGVASSIPLDHYSFETMDILRDNMKRWQKSIREGHCQEEKNSAAAEGQEGLATGEDCDAGMFLIEVSFDAIENEAERKHLKDLPTSFKLKPEDVDRLTAAAGQILRESDEFHAFTESLK